MKNKRSKSEMRRHSLGKRKNEDFKENRSRSRYNRREKNKSRNPNNMELCKETNNHF